MVDVNRVGAHHDVRLLSGPGGDGRTCLNAGEGWGDRNDRTPGDDATIWMVSTPYSTVVFDLADGGSGGIGGIGGWGLEDEVCWLARLIGQMGNDQMIK